MPYKNSIDKIINRIPTPKNPLDCWLWEGSLNTGGYAHVSFNYKTSLVHRLLYEDFIEQIPKHLHSDHLYRVRHCVNPLHIELVTQKENTLRGVGTGALNARKTHCKNGHKFNKLNTYINKTSGSRVYLVCFDSYQKIRYKRLHKKAHKGEQNG